MTKKNDKDSLFCSFCGKNQKEVKKLIAGPTVFVCDECVELCMDIIKEDNKNNNNKVKKDIPKPSEINKFLNDYVIGQDKAKKYYLLQYIIITKGSKILIMIVLKFLNQIYYWLAQLVQVKHYLHKH